MNRAQKIAWSCLFALLTGFVLSIVAVALLYTKVGFPRALRGFGLIGLGGLGGLSQLIFRKEQGKVQFDERDRLFHKRAWFAGYCASYLFFVTVCMTTWFIYGPKGTVSVNMLPLTVIGGLMALTLVHSITILEQYGWRNKGEKS